MKLEEKAKKYLDKIKKEDKKINAFLELNKNVLEEAKAIDKKKHKGRLAGYIIGVKSNINVLGMKCSCASRVLENYVSTYDATVVEKIKAEDGLIIGTLNCDEFAAGVSGENSAFGPTQNPTSLGLVPGGSSSGSAAAVAAGFCDMALGSDTGGSIRVPASFCGVVGVKPSYGCVSRYGLVDLSMSLDQIGPLAKNVDDATLLLDVIHGKDERDAKSFESGKIKVDKVGKIKVGVLKVKNTDKIVQSEIDKALDKVAVKNGWNVKEVNVKNIDLAIQTYHLLVWTEFFSATRRFDGRKYGYKIEEKAGQEVLRRIYGGSEMSKAEFSGKYYEKALQMKEVIKEEFERLLKENDCLIMPTVPVLPWKIGKKLSYEDYYAVDALTIPSNLAEVCAVSLPVAKHQGIPIGLQIVCGKGHESKMFGIASHFS